MLTRDELRNRVTVLQEEHRRAERGVALYRRLALLGWLAFVGALALQGTPAQAETLPQNSVACVDAAAWQAQQIAADFVLVQGCVYTFRDYSVQVEAPGVVHVTEAGMSVWVDAGVLRP